MTTTFAKGGLRLLVPEIMERELKRHFLRQAESATSALRKAHDTHPINLLGLGGMPSEEELKTKCLEEMISQWIAFKEHFVVEELPIVGDLNQVVNWYFDSIPPFAPGKKAKEFPDAFIISALDQYYGEHNANIAVIGNDNDFRTACDNRRHIIHFSDFDSYIETFKPEVSQEDILPGDVDPTKPIATEDLTEIKAILNRGDQVTSIEILRVIDLISNRGSNYDYFFQNVKDTVWLEPLLDRGHFDDPPNLEESADGRIVASWWPPMTYLKQLIPTSQDRVLDVISNFPDLDNQNILRVIVEIVLEVNTPEAIKRFSRFIYSFIDSMHFSHELVIELLSKPYIFDPELSDITPTILLQIVEFLPDPQQSEKEALRKENPEAYGTLLQPAPRMDHWEYQQVLEKGIKPLAQLEPYRVSRVLIDAVASMIRLSKHKVDNNKEEGQDYSEIWCKRLDGSLSEYPDSKEILARTLSLSCQGVFETQPQFVHNLDIALRNQNWVLFKRLRQHLYGSFTNEETREWIREQILDHSDYSRWEHHFEFQRLISNSAKHFGSGLLTQNELDNITREILSGPNKEDFRSWLGEQYSDEAYAKRKQYFHRMQLRPFAEILSGETLDYFRELNETSDESISDDSYSPHRKGEVGWVSYESPKTLEELQNLTDEELLSYINEWESEGRSKDSMLIEVNIDALSDEFQALFKKNILVNESRLIFWLENGNRVSRPIYISKIVKAVIELINEESIGELDDWIEFCSWIISHPDSTDDKSREDSRENPDWGGPRRTVVDFIDSCVSRDNAVSIEFREGLSNLLRGILSQPDYRLDSDRPVLLNRDDQVTEAINNTRSRALESLINFCFWIKRELPDDPLHELGDILKSRLSRNSTLRLSRPEYAMLGVQLGNISSLDKRWLQENLARIFPRENSVVWIDVFGSYIRYGRPTESIYDLLKDELMYAIDNIELFLNEGKEYGEAVNRIGQHVFTYYVWGVFSLSENDSLIQLFYKNTQAQKDIWGQLLFYAGRSLSGAGRQLEPQLVKRFIEFFEWRLEAGEILELKNFTYWLDAESLETEWKLETYSKVLDFGLERRPNITFELDFLEKNSDEYLNLVIECFRKITDSLSKEGQFYLPPNKAKPILLKGLNSEISSISKNAQMARENLLRLGLFEYID